MDNRRPAPERRSESIIGQQSALLTKDIVDVGEERCPGTGQCRVGWLEFKAVPCPQSDIKPLPVAEFDEASSAQLRLLPRAGQKSSPPCFKRRAFTCSDDAEPSELNDSHLPSGSRIPVRTERTLALADQP
jgi:hypothetical protein